MLFNLFKKTQIKDQVREYLLWKQYTKGLHISIEHKEWIQKFIALTKVTNVKEITLYDIDRYKEWLLEKYAGDYMLQQGQHAIRCLLRFYRCYGILFDMTKLGRKPNLKQIQYVQHFKKKGLSFRDIKALLERSGNKVHLSTLHFWAHYKL